MTSYSKSASVTERMKSEVIGRAGRSTFIIRSSDSGLVDFQDFAVNIDADTKAHHAHVSPAFFRDARFSDGFELLVEVFELIFDHGAGKDTS